MELDYDSTQTYHCPGCGGTSDRREEMERHEAGCVLALRQRVWELECRVHHLEDENERLGVELVRERNDAQAGAFRAEYRAHREALEAWNQKRGG